MRARDEEKNDGTDISIVIKLRIRVEITGNKAYQHIIGLFINGWKRTRAVVDFRALLFLCSNNARVSRSFHNIKDLMKLKRKTPNGLFPSPYKTKYTRYPIHFYMSVFSEGLTNNLVTF